MAVVDWEKDVRERCREQYGAQEAYADYSEALERVDVEVVVVATSPSSHAEIVAACLRAGKDVLCEKPPAPTVERLGDKTTPGPLACSVMAQRAIQQ